MKEETEYTLWDNTNNIFFNGVTSKRKILLTSSFGLWDIKNEDSPNDVFYFPYTGRKDNFSGKKIYENSSIFEFDYEEIYGDINKIKMVGYFEYRIDEMRYEVNILNSSKDKHLYTSLWWDYERMTNLKVIDTIQQNKLGLIKGEVNA